MQAQGHIQLFIEKGGQRTIVHEQKNLILFEGADIMSLLLSGDSRHKIAGVYFEYKNGTPSPTTITRSMGRTSFNSITGVDGVDWLRIPIISTPLTFSSAADYAANIVTFSATSAVSETMAGESATHNAFTPGTSQVYSLALVSMPDKNNSQLDKVFARTNLAAALTVPTGFHLGAHWSIKFN
jgi:hypothetical protein